MRKKFPDPPPEILRQLAATRGNSRPEVEVEYEDEIETEGGVTRAREEILKKIDFGKLFPAEKARLNREWEDVLTRKREDFSRAKTEEERQKVLLWFREKKQSLASRKEKLMLDALDAFWNHYESQGWKTSGGAVITNKIAKFESWMKKERQFAK